METTLKQIRSFEELFKSVGNETLKIGTGLKISVYEVQAGIKDYESEYRRIKHICHSHNKNVSEYHSHVNPASKKFGLYGLEKAMRNLSETHYQFEKSLRYLNAAQYKVERAIQEILDNQEFFNFVLLREAIRDLADEFEMNIHGFNRRDI